MPWTAERPGSTGSKGRDSTTVTVTKRVGLESQPLLAQDGSALQAKDHEGYNTITMMKPERDPIKSAHPVMKMESSKNPLHGMSTEVQLVCFCSGWVMFLEGINGMSGLATNYFFKETLKVEPAVLSSIGSITSLPWTCKPLYGFISDAYPMFGYRRKPYLLIAGILGSISWLLMSKYVTTVFFSGVCMTLGSGAIAVANVIAEAMVCEKSRGETQEYASRLQSIIYTGQAVGSILAAWTGGYLLTFMSDRQVFLLVASFPLSLVVIALIVPEERYHGNHLKERSELSNKLQQLWNAFKQPQIWRPCAFIFMLNATPATGATWFYFYTDVLKFSSEFLGTIGLVGSCFTLAGVFLFDATMRKASFRPVFLWSTVVSTILGLSQLILVFRYNLVLGIPDSVFCLGESAILSIVGWICTMPVLVLAARLCPEGMEGTMYALIMSINNLGGIVGSQLGAVLTTWLGVTEQNLSNFWLLVLICNLSTFLPLIFINWIPQDDPQALEEVTEQTAAVDIKSGIV
uniref:Major facilitator superfamily (MFS) profile domain-containing protein n=1 Tax=Hanusia phi TaxID=3032 RepID=A0A7S0E9A5_9CRYP|mmetsp:Transcript_19533/g.44676  ORF Transcript_19533/g.44676 Transcript_19533/m.44676 type:complete len:518 (+) Transcript_19533:64-1617(+)